jgi:TRAP-type C4-dicarboxylate transport system permease small subunit
VSKIAGNIGGFVLALMMLLTVADIIGRHAFNQPIYGALEISEFMLVIVVFFSAAHCEFHRGHVSIGLFVDRLGRRAQSILDSIVYFLFLATFCWLTYQLGIYATEAFQSNIVSGSLGVSKFPFIYIATFGCALLSLFVLVHFLLFLAGALKK